MNSPTRKAVLWHQGQLSPSENLSSYDLHIAGPKLPADGTRPTRFHTYACLFPEQGLYVAENTGAWPGYGINAAELRQIIADAQVPEAKILDQDAIAAHYVGPGATAQFRWSAALAMAMAIRLPIGFYAVGNTADNNEQVVYLRVVALAPLAMVIKKFKEAAPQIGFN